MQFLLMNPKAFSCNQPDGGGRLAAPFCMPPVGGGPPLVAGATTFPQLRWWDYGRSALCHMTLQESVEQFILPPGGGKSREVG